MSEPCTKNKSILKGIRFPPNFLADIEASIERESSGDNFSTWVLEACKHRLSKNGLNCHSLSDNSPAFGSVLTAQKKKFADYLMKGLNQTEAAILAGYGEKSARSKGSQLG